ncbi:hypothetical protein CMV_012527 [Castanea mollissima]|uniref:Late embryogenesis abundant protein LEA-2 subgroup domain-containing protein n=1 Tax=Castanea mollissima TaxID=60419 RepID=A0A8J4R1R7_9ROSI|nr:hypothetical protein CMV_012527 [Castanea mollissima]
MSPNSSSTQPSTSKDSASHNFVSRSIFVLLSFFVIITLVIYIAWLILKPLPPDFEVDSFTVSNFTVSGSQIRGKYDIQVTVRNPNKKLDFNVEIFDIRVNYRRTRLSQKSEAPRRLFLEKSNQTNVKAELDSNLSRYVRKNDLENLGQDLSGGVICFDVRMPVTTSYTYGNWPRMERSMLVYCQNLKVTFSSSKLVGKLIDGREDCLVLSD